MEGGNRRIIQSLTFCQNMLNSVCPNNKPTGQQFMVYCLLTVYRVECIQQAPADSPPNILQLLWGIQNKNMAEGEGMPSKIFHAGCTHFRIIWIAGLVLLALSECFKPFYVIHIGITENRSSANSQHSGVFNRRDEMVFVLSKGIFDEYMKIKWMKE